VSGVFGKWHLGVALKYNAMHRGFDEFYGFMGRGAHDYFELTSPDHPIYRGLEPIEDKGYLTDRITEEAVSFIGRHKARPFFLYVAYNAVHWPAQAPEDEIVKRTGDRLRDTLMAMLKHLDDGVGKIVGALKKEQLFDNTLLFYLTDNGGSRKMHANNAPLRGFKQDDYEGGIRVPFIVSWPAQLRGGTRCDVPLWSVDILPTALAAAGVSFPKEKPLDGKNLLPALKGDVAKLHDHLFWSSGGRDGKWAVRSGQWKLVGVRDRLELFDLEEDAAEAKDLAPGNPEKVTVLKRLHDEWLDRMAPPLGGQPKRWSSDVEKRPKGKRDRQADRRRRRDRSPPRDVEKPSGG
ncbi:MAG: sulfatase-like hydrolase/transferase, partial [Planctomycetota bacterium]|nr:sulfatase-like hydrolase/transferase [Planctomycetota bacterium]